MYSFCWVPGFILLMKTWVESSLSSFYLFFSFLSLLIVKTRHNNHALPTEGGGVLGTWGCETELLRVLGNAEGQLLILLCLVGPEAPCFSGQTITSASPVGAGCHFGLCPSTGSGKMGTAKKKKKSPLTLWGRWRRKKRCSLEEITGIQWLPFFGLVTCHPYTRSPSLELQGTNSPRGGSSSQAPKSPQVYAAHASVFPFFSVNTLRLL